MYTRLLCTITLVMTVSLKACDNFPPKPRPGRSDHLLQASNEPFWNDVALQAPDAAHKDAIKAAQQLDCDKVIAFIKNDGVHIDPEVQHNVAYCAIAKQQWPLLANALNHPDSSNWWNLAHHEQCTAACIALLAQHKVNLNHPGNMDSTPLHNAVARWDVDTTQALIQHGAHVHARNSLRQTPAHLIAEQIGQDIPTGVKLLIILQQATSWNLMRAKDSDGNTPGKKIRSLEQNVCSQPDIYTQQHCIRLISSLKELKEYYQTNFGKGVLCSHILL